MSVLSVPRLFFKGAATWTPATGNNNDQWPVYDFVNNELNWPFLEQYGITPDNVRDKFPQWALQLQPFDDGQRTWVQNPGEWGYFGGMEWYLHDGSANTTITGAQQAYGADLVTGGDPLINAVIDIAGDAFPGHSTFNTAGRIVDNNPDAWWGTNFYLRKVRVGTSTAPECYLVGDVAPGSYANSRWMSLQRNLNEDGELQIAGVGGAVLQVCLPKDTLDFGTQSGLLQEFKQKVQDADCQGLMVRCTVYMTQYFTADVFADCKKIPDTGSGPDERLSCQYAKLTALWDSQIEAGLTPSQNPCVSRVVGTIGLWHKDDPLTSAPGGRILLPQQAYDAPGGVCRYLGPAALEVHSTENRVTIDLGNTIPEINSTGEKKNFGSLELKLRIPGSDTLKDVATIDPDRYDKDWYESHAGLVDLSLPASLPVETADFELHYRPSSSVDPIVVLRESQFTTETDQRSIYLDQHGTAHLTVHVRQRGQIPQSAVRLRLQQYIPYPTPPLAGGESWQLPTASKDRGPVVAFQSDIEVPAGSGQATIDITPVKPGCATIAFFPSLLEAIDPPNTVGPFVQPPGVPHVGPWDAAVNSVSYTCVRVLPFHDGLPEQFNQAWQRQYSPQDAWDFLYKNVLYTHDVLYPAMKYYASLDLGDKDSVDRNIDQIVQLAEPALAAQGSTLYMPVTRELSAGQREVLKRYQTLVHNGWKHMKLEEMQ
ncbi:hypothetical protein ACFP1Z_18930 [Streptomyces gamaensis]|uniref:Uncharacterized protein n=1 Tax=Streptomyces gamaensis TaxID=1763542 RepID=A0ABW0Z377_9ACTN